MFTELVVASVDERFAEMQDRVDRSRIAFYVGVAVGALALIASRFVEDSDIAGAARMMAMALAAGVGGVFLDRKRALAAADTLRRDVDHPAWISDDDGLVFFANDGYYLEKRGGLHEWTAVGTTKRVRAVSCSGRRLILTGDGWSVDVGVPDGWTDGDTQLIRAKVGA